MSPLSRHRDREIDLGIGNEDIGDQTQIDDIAVHIRSANASELIENLFLGHVGHVIHSCRQRGWFALLSRSMHIALT
ncbi:hypothetical protein LP421_14305 [Rhizobium sp. RCAM05350]|nr:hypothetical protein LP421_14305 [Rhizobium sp. RCAM05350]